MKVNQQIVFRKEFDGSALLFDPESGETFGLNQTSTFIWEKLSEEMDKAGILAALKEACGGELPESAENDVISFIASLKEKNFVI